MNELSRKQEGIPFNFSEVRNVWPEAPNETMVLNDPEAKIAYEAYVGALADFSPKNAGKFIKDAYELQKKADSKA